MMISMSLRLMVPFSASGKKPRANCMVSVEPPSCLRVAGSDRETRNSSAAVVHAAVLEEAAVFDGQHRLDQILRDLVVGEQPALGAVGVFAQAGDQQRLQLIARQRLAVIVGDRLSHTPPLTWIVARSPAE